jgi:hypothetical protein
MSDLLPDIEMPPQQEEPVNDISQENIKENITAEINEVDDAEPDITDAIEPKHKEEPEEIFEEKPKKSRARKIPLSDKQKDHLAKAREKGLEVRRRKAAERKKIKEEAQVIQEQVKEEHEKETLKKKYNMEQPVNKVYQLDEDMIKKLKEDAIAGYDKKRKERKAKKKVEKQEQEVVQKSVRAITSAVKPAYNPDDVYANCFGFS